MTELAPTAAACIQRIRDIFALARANAMRSVNVAMVSAYWEVGREIVEEEQRGQKRAEYGDRLIVQISARLTEEFGKGFSQRSLRRFRQFYLTYRERQTPVPFGQDKTGKIWPTLLAKSDAMLLPELGWSHYIEIIKLFQA